MIINTCKISSNGWVINGNRFIPAVPLNRYYKTVQDWIAEGNTPEPEYTEEQLLQDLRRQKIREIKKEGVIRIAAITNDIDTYEEIKLIAKIWPGLKEPTLGADMRLAKDIYLYAKNMITTAETATQNQLNNYDATTDPNWPT